MRGRTNISGGTGAEINGDIITAEVAENNILSGDFVEYKQTENVQTLFSGIDVDIKRYIPLSENKYIAHVGDYLRIIDLSENRVDILYTMSSHVVNDFIMTGDNEFYAVCSTPASLIKFSIQGNQITVSDSASTPSGGNTGITLFDYGNKIYTVYPYTKSNGTYVTFEFYSFSKDQGLQYGEKFETTSSKVIGNSSAANTQYIINHVHTKEQYIFLNIIINIRSGGNTINYEWLVSFQIQDNRIDNEVDVSIEIDSSNDYFKYHNFIVFKDKYIFYQSLSGGRVYLNKYNIDINNSEKYDLTSYGIYDYNSSYTHLFNIAPIYETNKFIVNCSTYRNAVPATAYIRTAIFELTSAENIALVSNVLENNFNGALNALEAVLANEDNIFSITNQTVSSNKRMYSYAYAHSANYDTLSQPLDKNYVTPYHGGSAIGVAKDTGAIGKEIEIFVPRVIEG